MSRTQREVALAVLNARLQTWGRRRYDFSITARFFAALLRCPAWPLVAIRALTSDEATYACCDFGAVTVFLDLYGYSVDVYATAAPNRWRRSLSLFDWSSSNDEEEDRERTMDELVAFVIHSLPHYEC
jgi:hypothetical protein